MQEWINVRGGPINDINLQNINQDQDSNQRIQPHHADLRTMQALEGNIQELTENSTSQNVSEICAGDALKVPAESFRIPCQGSTGRKPLWVPYTFH